MYLDIVNAIDSFLWGTPFLAFVILVGAYFTIRSGFFPVFHFGHIMKHTLGQITSKEANEKKAGQVSPFEAACIAIGGCVGMGNIGGVATAVATGGPGAVFWMWLWAFFGMMVKCVEVTLGCHYRSKNERGEFFGGSVYFIEKGLGTEKKWKGAYALAIAFSIGFVAQFLGGSQAYTISEVLNTSFGFDMIGVTAAYTVVLYYLIWKGTPRIASFATKAVPFMTVTFILGGLGIIALNFQNVPAVVSAIFSQAFTGTAAAGGFAGAAVSAAMRAGIARSINSNEAGQGSSPLIHGSADTVHPVRQGLWGSFEVFTDTIIVCSVTALAILVTGEWMTGVKGATLTITAFQHVYGQAGVVFIGIMCALFGMTTTTGWYTYYVTIINYVLQNKPKVRDAACKAFKFLFPLPNMVIVSSIVLTGNGPDLFWALVDISLVIPVFTNLLAIFLLRDKFFSLLNDYKARYLGIGVIDPNFDIFYDDRFEGRKAVRETTLKPQEALNQA